MGRLSRSLTKLSISVKVVASMAFITTDDAGAGRDMSRSFLSGIGSILLLFRALRGHAGNAVDGHEAEELFPSGHGDRVAVPRDAERLGGSLRIERGQFPARGARVLIGDEVLPEHAVHSMFIEIEICDGLAVRHPAHAAQDSRRVRRCRYRHDEARDRAI